MSTGSHTLSDRAMARLGRVVRRVEAQPMFGVRPEARPLVGIRPNYLFCVKVLKDGGSNGSASTTVSWTYTVKTLGGTTLVTGKTPKRKRHSNTAYVDPSTTEYEGLAYVGSDGVITLYDANEIVDLEAC